MYKIFIILFAMLALQFMGLGMVLSKIGEPKTGTYSPRDVVINMILSFLYIYVIFFLYHYCVNIGI